MNIVLEGPDGSGKSTLAGQIAQVLGRLVQPSEGPPKYPGELNERIRRYAFFDGIIFDRHPVISQTIYATIRANNEERVDHQLEADFYNEHNIFIYCRATHLGKHVTKEHDTPEHLEKIERNYEAIIGHYDAWALSHANLIYRIGDDPLHVIHYLLHATGAAVIHEG